MMQRSSTVGARAKEVLPSWFEAMRPRHWIKNLLLFVPGFFAQLPVALLFSWRALAGFALVSLAASAGYLLNDALDRDADANHANKRSRPVPSGRISRRSAVMGWVCLAMVSLTGSSLLLGMGLTIFVAAYLALSALYSIWLKQVAWLDVATIASLFVLRLYAGGELHHVTVSVWLLGFSILFFAGLGFCKRLDELRTPWQPEAAPSSLRRGYKRNDRDKVKWLAASLGAAASLVLVGYLFFGQTAHSAYSKPYFMAVGIISTTVWYFRIWRLARQGRLLGDPVIFALFDRTCIALTALTLASFVAAR
jgi:4-hydroxybenzoate polyprenyltransferase